MATNCTKITEDVESCWEEGGYCDGCEKWEEKCCDWPPCSWFCDLIVRGACLVCKWVANIVCTVTQVVKGIVCTGADVASSLASLAVSVVEAALGWVFSVVGFVLGLITSFPGIGRVLGWGLNIAYTVINAVASVPDVIATVFGVMPEKKLRIAVIVLKDAEDNPIVNTDLAIRAVQYVINTFRSELNVRVIPLAYVSYRSAYAADQIADERFVYSDEPPSSSRLLDACCDVCAAGNDLATVGADFNTIMIRTTFWGNARRLIGYGAPIVAFSVRSFTDGKAGCSLGPLTDWVTVRFTDSNNMGASLIANLDLTPDKSLGSITDLAHEIAHACNLWHVNDADLLINPDPPRKGGFTRWQKAMVRASRHVTYL